MGFHLGRKLASIFLLSLFLFVSVLSQIPLVKAELFNDGFEVGDGFGAWTGIDGTPTIVTNPVHHGTNSCQIDGEENVTLDLGSSYSNIFVRTYVYFTTLPSSEFYKIWLFTVGEQGSHWNYATTVRAQNTDGENCSFAIISGAHTIVFGSLIIELNTWYSVELNRRTGSGNTTLYVDDEEECHFAYDYYDSNRTEMGGQTQLSSVEYLDCVVIDTSYIGLEVEGQDLTFNLFENFNVWSSLSASIETVGQDLTFPLFEGFALFSSVTRTMELHNPLFQNFNTWSSLTMNKEQGFSLFEPFNIWSSLSSATEGIAQDLTFLLFESIIPIASLSTTIGEAYVLEDALALAAIAFVLAIVAICLFFAFHKK